MNDEPIILATENHPFYSVLKERVVPEVSSEARIIIDLTLTSPDRKEQTIKSLEGCTVISDLTCYRGEEWVKSYPHVKGALGAGFPSPGKSCEIWAENETIGNTIEKFLGNLGMDFLKVRSPGVGFIYPRILAMIINEAWLALEDQLADQDNIDLAMKNGVNYPWGPFEWGERIGLDKVRTLLDELYNTVGNDRYRPCSLLVKTL